jgi:hypothetical protein
VSSATSNDHAFARPRLTVHAVGTYRLPRPTVLGYQVGRLLYRLVDGRQEPLLGLGVCGDRHLVRRPGRRGDRETSLAAEENGRHVE